MTLEEELLMTQSFCRQWEWLPARMSSTPLVAAIEDAGFRICWTCGASGIISPVGPHVRPVTLHDYENDKTCQVRPVCQECIDAGDDDQDEECPFCRDSECDGGPTCDDIC